VIKVVEKPKEWLSDYAVTGLYLYDNRVIKAAKNLEPSERGEIEIVDLHKFYLRRNELRATIFKGEWLDAGTFDSLLEASQTVKQKKLYKKFHPLVDKAIAEFNAELKEISKKKLN